MAHGLFVGSPSPPGCGPRWPGSHDPCHPFRPSTGRGTAGCSGAHPGWGGPRRTAEAGGPGRQHLPPHQQQQLGGLGPGQKPGPGAGATLRRRAGAGICGVLPPSLGTCWAPGWAPAPCACAFCCPSWSPTGTGTRPRLPRPQGQGSRPPASLGRLRPQSPSRAEPSAPTQGPPYLGGGCSCAPGSGGGGRVPACPGPLPGEGPGRGSFHGGRRASPGCTRYPGGVVLLPTPCPSSPGLPCSLLCPGRRPDKWCKRSREWCCYGPRDGPLVPIHTGGTEGEGQAPEAAAATEGEDRGEGPGGSEREKGFLGLLPSSSPSPTPPLSWTPLGWASGTPASRRLSSSGPWGGGTPTQTQTQNNALGPGHTTPHTQDKALGVDAGNGTLAGLAGDRVQWGGGVQAEGAAEGSVVRCWAQTKSDLGLSGTVSGSGWLPLGLRMGLEESEGGMDAPIEWWEAGRHPSLQVWNELLRTQNCGFF